MSPRRPAAAAGREVGRRSGAGPAATGSRRPSGGGSGDERLALVATCCPGLEQLAAGELAALGIGEARPETGAVLFRGDWQDAWRACVRLRTANRVLVRLGAFPAATDDELARGAAELVAGSRTVGGVPVAELLHPSRTLAIRATSRGSRLTDTRWISLRTKDGIVDAQRRRFGRRSSIDKRSPDLPLRVWLAGDRAVVLADLAGEPLDRRGYRVRGADAPLREQLAAACVLAGLEGLEGGFPRRVLDPMCGSGTLLAEAGWIALGRAPGAGRETWPFTGWPGFEAARFRRLREEALPAPGPEVELLGIDRAPEAVAAARANLEAAGLGERSRIRLGDAHELASGDDGPGLLLVNPVWGERLASSREDWRALGDLLKQRFAGWRAVVVAGDEGRGKHLGLRPGRRIPVRQGPVDARILVLDLY